MAALENSRRNLARAPLFAGLACLISLACNALTPASPPTSAPPAPSVPTRVSVASASPATSELATPYALSPAAGICARFDGPVVEFRIEPGIPDPRCAFARADQHMKITNKTDGPLDVSIGTYSGHLEPGGEFSIEAPFGSYLAPGVHQLQVLPCCGPEIVLEEPPQ
jgi:hypothetical protein